MPASFRDPAGFVFTRDGKLYRQVAEAYRADFELLSSSGLLAELTEQQLLVRHEEHPLVVAAGPGACHVLEPERVPFISYPYEWSFTQLQDAALLTLEVQRRALERGMTLRDASAYNVQFLGASPVLIDTLSLGRYEAGSPWQAYRQFCQHFLAPLLLMSRVDVRLGRLLQLHLDGVPVDLASRLLPRRTWLRWGPLLHVHLHARSLARHADTRLNEAARAPRMSPTALRGLIDSLRSNVQRLTWRASGTEWAEYASGEHSYTAAAHAGKAELVRDYLSRLPSPPAEIWDLGANTGTFSKVAASTGARVISFDVDPAAVERNYLEQRPLARSSRVLPLLLDLTNPSPGIGWRNRERSAWTERGRPDAIMALALVHHLAIGNNLPLPDIAALLADLAPSLIIEFVPKQDSQVQRLLGSRPDIFPAYDVSGFEAAFSRHFTIRHRDPIPESPRLLYLMVRAG